jgi:hypothetical protein
MGHLVDVSVSLFLQRLLRPAFHSKFEFAWYAWGNQSGAITSSQGTDSFLPFDNAPLISLITPFLFSSAIQMVAQVMILSPDVTSNQVIT